MTVQPGGQMRQQRRRMSGMSWMFLCLLIFFVAAGAFTAIVKRIPRNLPVRVSVIEAKSYAGVDDFETAEDGTGVTFANVEPPGGPADKAGLIGGDVITTIDGQPVRSDDEIRDMMRRIPIGKTVDVVYLRDGETKITKLTTISEAELERLNDLFSSRPEGRGLFGYQEGGAERVAIPNTKMFGVQLRGVLPNRSADLAGIKDGDIVIKFGDTPIRTTDEFLSRVRRAVPYSTVTVEVIRNGEHLEIPVKIGRQG
jgi:S1-C subfamily serine protease